jgi:hypothetical protein
MVKYLQSVFAGNVTGYIIHEQNPLYYFAGRGKTGARITILMERGASDNNIKSV